QSSLPTSYRIDSNEGRIRHFLFAAGFLLLRARTKFSKLVFPDPQSPSKPTRPPSELLSKIPRKFSANFRCPNWSSLSSRIGAIEKSVGISSSFPCKLHGLGGQSITEALAVADVDSRM